MSRVVVFVRLPEGRLWHVQDAAGGMGCASDETTMCGRDVTWAEGGREPETLEGHTPAGAWVCRPCRDALAALLAVVDLAVRADPRRRRADPLPEPEAGAPEPTPTVTLQTLEVGRVAGVRSPLVI